MKEMTLMDVEKEVAKATEAIGIALNNLLETTGLKASHVSIGELDVTGCFSEDREFIRQPYIHLQGSHIHYRRDGRGHRKVMLNGSELRGAVFVDTERGYAEVHCRDDSGLIRRCGHDGKIQTKIVHGDLEVQFY